ncbi:MAG: YifB family Mg chelatase-like AAA ATPase [Lachnospiraceae bacterium]|nr:YifB family Mg chelatase-like AAA ATPase [Lachnospiraceae bacterium]
MYSKVYTAALNGVQCRIISVETDVSDGLPTFSMVGYLASEVKEAQERVRTALRNSGYPMHPKRVMVNLAPADIRKSGSGYDLPIAIALLIAHHYLPSDAFDRVFFAGELGLDGSICRIPGVLGMVMEAKRAGFTSCIIPQENAPEGGVIQGIAVYGASTLRDVVNHLLKVEELTQVTINIEEKLQNSPPEAVEDFADIRGQAVAKRAAEIAAAGMHNLLLTGQPGVGKTMIARRIPGILPPLQPDEALEVSHIHSVAGTLPKEGILVKRPFRMPHHTITAAALAGGGMIPQPGEISLAHRGVLYLDELPEFQREALEILRQPLEEGEVRISRSSGQYVFPADFMLVASRNPCYCGYYPDRTRCTCSEGEIRSYLHRISRPLLDRIDLHAEVRPITYQELSGSSQEESSAQIRERVLKAQEIQSLRYQGTPIRFNSGLPASMLEKYCELGEKEDHFVQQIYETKKLTARACHRMLRVARTIADLDASEKIEVRHLSEAVRYRPSKFLE